MKPEQIKSRVLGLLAIVCSDRNEYSRSQELFQGTLSIMSSLYGQNSVQVQNFIKEADENRKKFVHPHHAGAIILLAEGALRNVLAEVKSGLISALEKAVTGDVLADFLRLARAALSEKDDEAKNVAAVLTAALFEDTMRRLAAANGVPHIEKLQDVITELKVKGILQGSQVGIANSYLSFRNNSLHAQWDKVERESVASVLAFVEQLLLKHFS